MDTVYCKIDLQLIELRCSINCSVTPLTAPLLYDWMTGWLIDLLLAGMIY